MDKVSQSAQYRNLIIIVVKSISDACQRMLSRLVADQSAPPTFNSHDFPEFLSPSLWLSLLTSESIGAFPRLCRVAGDCAASIVSPAENNIFLVTIIFIGGGRMENFAPPSARCDYRNSVEVGGIIRHAHAMKRRSKPCVGFKREGISIRTHTDLVFHSPGIY
jgi:hypothetical protein